MKGSFKYSKLMKMNTRRDLKGGPPMSAAEAEESYNRSNSWSANINWRTLDMATVAGVVGEGRIRWTTEHIDRIQNAWFVPGATPKSREILVPPEPKSIRQLPSTDELPPSDKKVSREKKFVVEKHAPIPQALSPLGSAAV